MPVDDPEGLVELVAGVELVEEAAGGVSAGRRRWRRPHRRCPRSRRSTRPCPRSRPSRGPGGRWPRQRDLAAGGGIVMAGRDIGTVVLPDADLKIYLDASVEERARRRAEERGLDPDCAWRIAILEALRRRDRLDTTRAVAPSRVAPDARIITTDGNRFEETVARSSARSGMPSPSGRPAHRDAGRSDERRRSSRTSRRGCRLAAASVSAWRPHPCAARGRSTRSRGRPGDHRREPQLEPGRRPVLGSSLMPALGRRLQWLGKKELFDWPIVGWIARNGGSTRSTAVRRTSRPSGSPRGSSRRGTSCSCSRRGPGSRTGRWGRGATEWRCWPSGPGRRSSRSG